MADPVLRIVDVRHVESSFQEKALFDRGGWKNDWNDAPAIGPPGHIAEIDAPEVGEGDVLEGPGARDHDDENRRDHGPRRRLRHDAEEQDGGEKSGCHGGSERETDLQSEKILAASVGGALRTDLSLHA